MSDSLLEHKLIGYNEEISKPLNDSFTTMSHFPWIYLKHTQEAIGPPPTS